MISAAAMFQPASILAALALGAIGSVEGDHYTKTIQNDGGAAQEVWTVTVGSTSSSTTHSFDIYPSDSPGAKQTVTYASADSNTTNAATGLKEYFTDTTLSAYGLASVSQSTNVLTFTGRISGVAITLDNASNVTLSNSTDAAEAERVGPGLCMIRTGYDSGTNRTKGRKAVSSAFTAMSVAFTIAGVDTAGARIVTTIRYAGYRPIIVSTVYDGSGNDTTVTAHKTAINTAMDAAFPAAQSVVATDSSGVLTLTADVAGACFDAETRIDGPDSNATVVPVWVGGSDDVPPWDNITYSLPAAFLGISKFSSDMRPSTLSGVDAAVGPNEGVEIITGGPGVVYVDLNSLTIVAGQKVWVDLTTSAAGRAEFYNVPSASTSRVALWHPTHGYLARYVGKGGDGATAIKIIQTLAY